MQKKGLILSAATALATTALAAPLATSTNNGNKEENKYTPNNLTLHYDRPAQFFEEALVIGNGLLGGIVYSGVETDSISLNDITLWTGEPDRKPINPDGHKALPEVRRLLDEGKLVEADEANKKIQGHFTENYQPVGRLYIDHLAHKGKTAKNYGRKLDISNAEAFSSYEIDGNEVKTEYFVSAPDSVIVVRLSTTAPEGLDERIRISSPLPHGIESTSDNSLQMTGYVAWHSMPNYTSAERYYDPARGMRFSTRVKVVAPGATLTASNDSTLNIKGGNEAMILITNATSFNGSDKDPATEGRDYKAISARRLKSAEGKTFSQLRQAHNEDYTRLFNRVSIDLGETDPAIASLPTDTQLRLYTEEGGDNPDLEELYYQYARYLLISSSRTPGIPANLQGLWNESILPPWSSNYTTNINLEENYWGAETGNLSEMHMAMLEFIKKLPVTGEQSAKAYYGVQRGWSLGHNSDIWAMTCPVGLKWGDPSWANWNMGGAWIATHIWEHYLFTRDLDFLKEYYPVLKGAAEFCLDWMVEDENGELITSPGTSPENKYLTAEGKAVATAKASTSDLAMIRECLLDTEAAASELGVDSGLRQEIKSALSKMRPYHVGKAGNLMEWSEDFKDEDPHHRHQSHLFGLYPGHHISVEATPNEAAAAAKTLEIKGFNTTGWSAGWRVNLYARLCDKANSYHMLRKLLSYVSPDNYRGPDARRGGGTYPNLLDAHSPFQIDGNFGGAAGMTEMLMQSTPTEITLLPSLPEKWNKGEVKGIVARGGFIIDMAWDNGKVVSLNLTSRKGGKTNVRFNGQNVPVSLKEGESLKLL